MYFFFYILYGTNSCSLGLRYVSWYKCLIVNLVFPTAVFGVGTSRQRSRKGAIRKRFPFQKRRWEKQSDTYTMTTRRKPKEQLFFQKVATQLPKYN